MRPSSNANMAKYISQAVATASPHTTAGGSALRQQVSNCTTDQAREDENRAVEFFRAVQ
jgi:hypothetical protein